MKHIIVSLFLLATITVAAQSLDEQHLRLAGLMREVAADTSTQKAEKMQAFNRAFEEVLRQEGAIHFSFDSIPHLGTLVSDDGKVRMFTWNLPVGDSGHRYYGIVQYRPDKSTVVTTVLTDVKDTLSIRPERAALHGGHWFGALYYQLVQTKAKRNTYYTLLGFDFLSGATHRKLLEALTFDETGQPVFGTPLFDNGRWKAGRVLLDYSAGSPFFLQYLPRRKMIVYQRLEIAAIPIRGNLPGRVPTDAFDGLVFTDGRWTLQKDVDTDPRDFRR